MDVLLGHSPKNGGCRWKNPRAQRGIDKKITQKGGYDSLIDIQWVGATATASPQPSNGQYISWSILESM